MVVHSIFPKDFYLHEIRVAWGFLERVLSSGNIKKGNFKKEKRGSRQESKDKVVEQKLNDLISINWYSKQVCTRKLGYVLFEHLVIHVKFITLIIIQLTIKQWFFIVLNKNWELRRERISKIVIC